MELMKGKDMYSYIKNKKLGPPTDIYFVKDIAQQFLSAIEYLHKKEIVHLDLKPENLVFSENYQTVKIIDLGVAQKLNIEAKFCSTAENGTDRYKSPEQLKGLLTFKIDIW
jgi:serine/threonine protein kinase